MIILQYISIAIELAVAIIGLFIFFNKKKKYGLGIFLTFVIYVFYDLARLMSYSISESILQISFFIASLSALWAVCLIYRDASKENLLKRIAKKIIKKGKKISRKK